ncbi:ArsR/SmtB family transcription factor [Thiococcus pfennigii]|jgi:rhodanese-related sulfurtransferase/DNA-binding transcriptional ArsR family regulator|uniref:ArsR/SmtB family transcription factor n=1 Tax=Thiococcus pfennigii TaxID=1057 RepID=UPI001904AA7A|nr:metalloregulator ArsR/SmtB family transcription factor [Thiococcus pfennigii]MBK1702231.1 ArsR family transcriptional regulator [Thiococcus pfennigii]
MNKPQIKALLYGQVARISKALSSPKRLELLELLAQGEKTVESLARESGDDVKLVSAHLKALREARLVVARRAGRFMVYRASGADVGALLATLRDVAETHLVELRLALAQLIDAEAQLTGVSREQLLEQAQRGEVLVLDVRPETEYRSAHLPHARSIPLDELEDRLETLPADVPIVAYCRGPFCLMSEQAVALLRTRGFRAARIEDGVNEWLAHGLSVERLEA